MLVKTRKGRYLVLTDAQWAELQLRETKLSTGERSVVVPKDVAEYKSGVRAAKGIKEKEAENGKGDK